MNPKDWEWSLYGWRLMGVLTIAVGTLVLWLLLGRAATRTRRNFQDLLNRSQQALGDPDAQAAVDIAQQRLTALRLLVNGARYVLLIAAILLILDQLNISLGSLLLPAGFLGAAIGLGSQNLVRDLVAGFFIVFEGQFSVGDRVTINGTAGVVEELGLRVTRLRDESGQVFFFPNGAIATIARQPRRAVPMLLMVPLAPAEDRAAATRTLLAAIDTFEALYESIAGDPTVLDGSGPTVSFNLLARPHRVLLLREKLPGRLKATLEAAGIEMQKGADVEITFAPS